MSSGVPVSRALMTAGEALGGLVEHPEIVNGTVVEKPAATSLRDRGAELLHRSRDVWNTDQGHPAFDRILDELAPDEGRILLLLLKGGPQPSVDVRTGGPIGMVSSDLIAPGLTMIGARAGCRYLDQVPSYLNNLFRLGLVWFSKESLPDPLDYQVLEAQPDVLEALHSVKFAKIVRRSIHLTPFGEAFCRTALVGTRSPRPLRSRSTRRRRPARQRSHPHSPDGSSTMTWSPAPARGVRVTLCRRGPHRRTTALCAGASAGPPSPLEVMEASGFDSYDCEWWHYTLADEPFPETYFDFPIS